MEESLLLPTQDVGLFAKTFLLIFAHTFIFIAVAVHFAHPLATSILADIKAHRIVVTTDTASSNSNHSKALSLLAIYLSYLASKLATQLVTSLATATTYSGERLTRKAINKERIGGLLGTAVLAGVLELLLTALLVVLLVSTWTWTYADSGMKKSLCGYLMFSVALLLYIYLATAITVSVGVSAVDRGCHSVWALRRAWRLMAARRKEAAVLVFVVNLLPAFIYPAPVYAFSSVYRADEYSLFYGQDLAGRFSLHRSATWSLGVWLMGVVSGSGLPSIGAQLFSMVAATVFCCLSTETNDGTRSPGPVV
ncbi:hypothetical protein BDA96_10G252000 [Sorghum bicolor]|uniref:Uncharacterized protein n=2 Tax=Sorghum bicolor TaxID=4558 RepID=A0A921Q6C8_SORBI|nr:uncharacterized protein LOC8083458 [Sorghum bicolor]EER88657.1 hypothetical protein SORBI_3010G193200 [Sorghum bicolor]KAG0515120.1 hypothetical protein BDA96_10G252000 [Sorghum bicolor]|eukprot:XP_002437290.1 uncharacterized protein LOC8083458 [Sorghum bicolor]